MSKHTPLPWSCAESPDQLNIYTPEDTILIATCDVRRDGRELSELSANSKFITKAANHYKILVELAADIRHGGCVDRRMGKLIRPGAYATHACGECLPCRAQAILAKIDEGSE